MAWQVTVSPGTVRKCSWVEQNQPEGHQKSISEVASKSCIQNLLEMQVLKSEVSLYDACGLHPGPQHVLLGGNVI